MKDRVELIKDLKSAVIHLAFSCYSEDKAIQETVLKIGQAINDAIDYLENEGADK